MQKKIFCDYNFGTPQWVMERCEITNLRRGKDFNGWCGHTYIHDDKNYVVKKLKP
jgi:hypothetical protein